MADSILQSRKECYLTGSTQGLLRGDWHNLASYGVHFDRALDMQLKQTCQRKFERLYGRDKFIEVFGKSYI